jgi:hypothetical protein
MIHKCEKCGQEFAITEATRSQKRLFKKSLPWRSYDYKMEEYFTVSCPNCQFRQTADEIRMFGVFSRRTARLGLPLVFIGVLLLVLILDRLR